MWCFVCFACFNISFLHMKPLYMPRIGPLFELAWFSLVLPLGHIHILLPKYATRRKIYPCFYFLYPICSLNVLQFSVNLSNIPSFTASWISSYILSCFGVYLCGVFVGFKFGITVLLILDVIFRFVFWTFLQVFIHYG